MSIINIDFSLRIGRGNDAMAVDHASAAYKAYLANLVLAQQNVNPYQSLTAGLANAWTFYREPEVPDTHHTAALKAKIIDARYRILGERAT